MMMAGWDMGMFGEVLVGGGGGTHPHYKCAALSGTPPGRGLLSQNISAGSADWSLRVVIAPDSIHMMIVSDNTSIALETVI